jgi:predicted GNAT family acetyltransferase
MDTQEQEQVVDAPSKRRYELLVDGSVAGVLAYRHEPYTLELVHTEIESAYQGQGRGEQFLGRVLDDVRRRGLSIVPVCPFVQWYLERHPEYTDLVAVGDRAGA